MNIEDQALQHAFRKAVFDQGFAIISKLMKVFTPSEQLRDAAVVIDVIWEATDMIGELTRAARACGYEPPPHTGVDTIGVPGSSIQKKTYAHTWPRIRPEEVAILQIDGMAAQPVGEVQPVAFREVAADGTPITDWIDGSLPSNTPPLHPGATIQFAYGEPAAEPIAWEATTPFYTKYITDERYQKLHPGFKPWYKPYRCSQCSSSAATVFPDALTPELSYVLGMPNFRCAPYAEIFREAGHDIPRKAEAEQAFVIHRMACAVLHHGAGWDAAFAAELHAAADSAKAAAAAGLQKGGA